MMIVVTAVLGVLAISFLIFLGVEMVRFRKCRVRLQELYDSELMHEQLLDDARAERDNLRAERDTIKATAELQALRFALALEGRRRDGGES